MNFGSERNKPIFVTRSISLNAANSREIINEALKNRAAIHASYSGDFIVNAATANRLPKSLLVRVNESLPDEMKDLVVSRLEADKDEKFQFLDGRVFSGAEAAREVRQNSAVGQYFIQLETETLRIVQEAYFNGELG